jgi:PAS domain S-box-containing protein
MDSKARDGFPHVLIVDSDDHYRRLMARILEERYLCSVASSTDRAREMLTGQDFGLLVCDAEVPGEQRTELLRKLVQENPDLALLVVSDDHESNVIAEVRQFSSTCGYLLKPFSLAEFQMAAENLLCCQSLKLEQQSLRQRLETQARLVAHLEEQSSSGLWVWDTAKDQATWSEKLHRIFGTSRDEWPQLGFKDGLAFIHPDDRERVKQVVTEATSGGSPFELSCRIIRADGEYRTVETSCASVLGEDGNVAVIFGTTRDLTEETAHQ